jgi:hypothetical protein
LGLFAVATLTHKSWQKASKSPWALQRAFCAAQGAKRTPRIARSDLGGGGQQSSVEGDEE